MNLSVSIQLNKKLFYRDPESSVLGKKIINNAIVLLTELGVEEFTFKKLAIKTGTTEASVYRYFENKHKLLIYLISWYWSWMEYLIHFETNNITNTETKLKTIIRICCEEPNYSIGTDYINKKALRNLLIQEGSKTYLHKNVLVDNKEQLYKPYKDLCSCIAEVIKAHNPKYKYPRSLSSSLLEMSHYQIYFMNNLPSLTDFGKEKTPTNAIKFLEHFVFSCLKKN